MGVRGSSPLCSISIKSLKKCVKSGPDLYSIPTGVKFFIGFAEIKDAGDYPPVVPCVFPPHVPSHGAVQV